MSGSDVMGLCLSGSLGMANPSDPLLEPGKTGLQVRGQRQKQKLDLGKKPQCLGMGGSLDC